jgi:hypothetical protein
MTTHQTNPNSTSTEKFSQFNIVTKHEIVAEADPLSAHNVDILRSLLPLFRYGKRIFIRALESGNEEQTQ